ncbi:MAG: DUF3696 domain-containing protein [Pseudanabaena sp. M57BS1SP1A06MG]|nr:DUF3696 domain-containing protein [Pseudanabaena sp. M53BS1SP1A06MG]MCA6582426.1 DUF3696 domain-containing protein [Pseudanabaena sp. M34BS1SP1A06MG]MCA6594663.1 DUF3696 domain-containing protein [Pseudanabaena sp. M38BS1SP1A06MG]MCA6602220.1 DUF3696 domain-containing protein [Pseudanabaena sp. M57BS1SP1A06MG]
MLTEWTLENFKSVYDKTALELAPLTIFSGANSSGKSTVIQSILLTAQTLQNTVYPRPVVLNGHIVKLGAFNDVVSSGEITKNIQIGFKVKLQFNEKTSRSLSMRRLLPFREIDDEIESNIYYQFSFSSSGSIDNKQNQLQPLLENSRVKVDFSKGNDILPKLSEEIYLERTTEKIEERIKLYELSDLEDDSQTNSLAYEVTVSPTNFASRRRPEYLRVKDNESHKFAGASLTHFLPKSLSLIYDSVDLRAKEILDAITSVEPEKFYIMSRFRGSALLLNTDIHEALEKNESCKKIYLQIGNKFLNKITAAKNFSKAKKALEDLDRNFDLTNIYNFLGSLTASQKKLMSSQIAEKYDDLMKAVKGIDQPVFKLTEYSLPDSIDFAVSYIQTFFNQYVKYLGPLRDEPKPVYPLAGGTDSKDIGFSGEHTAAVLDVHSQTQVNYIPSNFFEIDITTVDRPSFVKASLIESVFDWLNYMGIASQVHTGDLGKLGHELKVSTIGSHRLHELTHVGVGVSQVLPILVLALLAEANSVLIFEQPELHLHPKVQTRLADFFVSMTMLGKQCIVETHSEYMINRLRYRSAKAIDDSISKNVIIYFVEKIEEKSFYRPVRINKYGVIDKWPKGFFDESHDTASEILREGMKKKKLERN